MTAQEARCAARQPGRWTAARTGCKSRSARTRSSSPACGCCSARMVVDMSLMHQLEDAEQRAGRRALSDMERRIEEMLQQSGGTGRRSCRSRPRCRTSAACSASATASRASPDCRRWRTTRSSCSRTAPRARCFDLAHEVVGCVLYGDEAGISAGSPVARTGRLAQRPGGRRGAGPGHRPAGTSPGTAGEPLAATEWRDVEEEAPGVLDRQPVREPLLTGLKVIDAAVPIGLRPTRAHPRRPRDRQDEHRHRHDHQSEGHAASSASTSASAPSAPPCAR